LMEVVRKGLEWEAAVRSGEYSGGEYGC
jgi:hypothetical protein